MPNPSRLSRATSSPHRSAVDATAPAGIVHLGLGNFHRAHQAAYTARALELEPGPWRIHAFANRSREVVDAMRQQDLLYSILEVSPAGSSVWVPAVHARVDVAAARPGAVVDAIAAPTTRIVTLTVTEHGYTYSPATHDLDLSSDAVRHDLAGSGTPLTTVGQLAAGLARRFGSSGAPMTVVSCDNLGDNGPLLRQLVTTFARHSSPAGSEEFLAWLRERVSFPSTMVDRIVPATTDHHRRQASRLLDAQDSVPVPAEPFAMWVMQDQFAAGRPAWDRAGAVFTDDVKAYELLKLRLLNGTHSLIAYLGVLDGAPTIPEAIRVPYVEAAARRLMREEYLPTVRVPDGVDVEAYMEDLFTRFSNTELGHRTTQVGSDGSQKLPQRITLPALSHLGRGAVPQLICLTVAAFLACVAPTTVAVSPLASEVKDPMRPRLAELAAGAGSPRALVDAVLDGTDLLPAELAQNPDFRGRVAELLQALELGGVESAVGEALR